MTKSLKFALFGNVYQEHKSIAAHKFINTAQQLGLTLAIHEPFYNFLCSQPEVHMPECEIIKSNDFTADYAVCIGGDGTFLDTASKVADKNIPVIGINAGRLGFLANFSPDHIDTDIKDIISGSYSTQIHSVLNMKCDEIDLHGYPFALNEVAILKHDISSMITIHTSINGEPLTTYQADGLIVSTPTGSTAYSLSVGGPIIVPQSNTLCLTPIAPHSLNMRPIVLCDDYEIDIMVESRSQSFLVSLDGRSQSYPDKIHLHIKKAPYHITVVTRHQQSYFSTLRKKMMWGADTRE